MSGNVGNILPYKNRILDDVRCFVGRFKPCVYYEEAKSYNHVSTVFTNYTSTLITGHLCRYANGFPDQILQHRK